MGFADIIAREAESLSPKKQAEILDFIAFLKMRQLPSDLASVPKATGEIESFFRGFNVDVSGYQFDRDDANARYHRVNGHGKCAAPDDETCHARSPLSNFPPHAGGRANESLREFHVKEVGL